MALPTDRPPIRLLVETHDSSGALNMATDECLFESALNQEVATVRIYGWEQATISLGYFQPPDDPDRMLRFGELPTVRRLSGGGAILHHQEITYSITIGPAHPLVCDPGRLYRLAHEAIRLELAEIGFESRLRETDLKYGPEPFLCFSRGDKNDLVHGSIKVAGSAQRRRRGAVLQHGSLILRSSPHAPEILGIQDLASDCVVPSNLREQIGSAIAEQLSDSFELGRPSLAEQQRIQELAESRYSHLNWGRGSISGGG